MVQSTARVRSSHYLPTIASLPDGNYRYVTANHTAMTDTELAQTDALIFLFRKNGNQIIGQLSIANGSRKICISGEVNVNTITGQAVELFENLEEVEAKNSAEEFTNWDVTGSLRVRRSIREGNKVTYKSAILDLNGYNHMNTGTEQPPMRCPF
ncbi:MAG: hypothetical protein SWJ54_03660 [Cyanobacteriota bacterium]|nr:hypothetical protein [Cyanobacteriota bacterium]